MKLVIYCDNEVYEVFDDVSCTNGRYSWGRFRHWVVENGFCKKAVSVDEKILKYIRARGQVALDGDFIAKLEEA